MQGDGGDARAGLAMLESIFKGGQVYYHYCCIRNIEYKLNHEFELKYAVDF